MGVSLGLDTLRFMSIDIDLRNNVDFLMLKAVGVLGLPDDLQWLYSFMDPHKLATMPKQFFGILTKEGDIGFGRFSAISWHKQEGEDILSKVGIEILERNPAVSRTSYARKLPEEEIQKVIELYKQGYNILQISVRTHHARDVISRIIYDYQTSQNNTSFGVTSAGTTTTEKSQLS